MSDFAEGLISAIAGGVQGGAEATGQIYEDERKNAARIETETQLAQAQAEIQLQKQKQLTVFAESQRREGKKADFEEEGKNLPETLRRGGLIEAEKTNAEKAKWNDPEYRKARSLEEGITNPDRGAGLRAEQTKAARLSNDQAQMLVDKRNAWMNEPNQTKKAKLGEEYQALTGKDPDKFAPVMGKDDAGNPVFLGSFDTKNNQFTSASDLASKGSTSVMDKLKGVNPENGNPKATSTTTQPPASGAAQPSAPQKMSIQQVDQELKKIGEPMMGWSDAMTQRRKDLLKLRTSLLGNQ